MLLQGSPIFIQLCVMGTGQKSNFLSVGNFEVALQGFQCVEATLTLFTLTDNANLQAMSDPEY
jgi:hypothetical protein